MINPPHATASASTSLVMFTIEHRRFAVPLSAVERVMPVKEIQPLTGGSAKLLGFTLLADRPVPVLNLRRHLGLAERRVRPSDRFLLVRSGGRTIALVAEENKGGVDALGSTGEAPRTIEGIVQMDNGLTLIFDFDRLLDDTDRQLLDQMIRRRQTRRAAVATATAAKKRASNAASAGVQRDRAVDVLELDSSPAAP